MIETLNTWQLNFNMALEENMRGTSVSSNHPPEDAWRSCRWVARRLAEDLHLPWVIAARAGHIEGWRRRQI
jgi:hypothetical protein